MQRPLDNKNQIRIILEAEAVLGIIGLCETDKLELLSSDVLQYEVSRNPKTMRREFGLEILSKAGTFIKLNESIERRANEFEKIGISPLDALHLASAEEAEADYFCTCDDKFLKKTRLIIDLKMRVVSPLELIEELEDGS